MPNSDKLELLKIVREKNEVISKSRPDARKKFFDDYLIDEETRDILEGKDTGIPIVTKSGKVSAVCGLAITKEMKDINNKKAVLNSINCIDTCMKEMRRLDKESLDLLDSLDPQTKAMLKYLEETDKNGGGEK